MIRADIDNQLVVVESITGQTVASNTTVNGTSKDLRTLVNQGHDARVMAAVHVGARTDGTFTFAIQDSADNSSFAAVTLLTGAVGAISVANTQSVGSYLPVANRPYVRVSVTSTVVTSGAIVSAELIIAPEVV